ncbi:PilZ domain-containing protein [Paenibacillus sp. GCM10023248]|uniref:PilZ domain-containing protein n=1 Tax=Bacillales TaxID=1385 RepID=UPI0023796367|nr:MULTISPECIES: PilZ domain-containing protein [Bacillales]MDD9271037.1 PilZ domain-containing protein [Paenibacillus sp. MAHUQ-63]MDR6882825.1 c-di-GMP-binding flagellar brake protein YcgR [Bacillus sp. 3255]
MSQPNKRSSFRIHLQIPLSAMFKIIGIKNKAIETKHSKIMIKDISAGGIRMHTPLNLPTEMSLLLEFTFLLFHQEMKILGVIKRKTMLKPTLYEYGIEFSIADPVLEQQLTSHLIMLYSRLRRNNVLASCSFCSEDDLEDILALQYEIT